MEFASTLRGDYEKLKQGCPSDLLEVLDAKFTYYMIQYRVLYESWLASRSGIMSTMITGRANFPVRRMEKKNQAEHGRVERLIEYRTKALKAIHKAIHPEQQPIRIEDDDAVSRLQEKIDKAEKFQATMKAANRIIRRAPKNRITGEKMKALVTIDGISESTAKQLFDKDFAGNIGFASFMLTNNNANIRRMRERIETITRAQSTPTTTKESDDGIIIEDCPSENRIKVFFPGKPDAEIRRALKAHGFRWAPSENCWKAYRNHNSISHANTYHRDEK